MDDPATIRALEAIKRKVESILGSLDADGDPAAGDTAVGADAQTALGQAAFRVVAGGAPPPAGAIDARIVEAFKRISAVLDIRQLYDTVMDAVIEVTGAQRGFLMLIEDGNKLRFKAGRGITPEVLAGREFSASMIRKVMTEARPVFLTDTEDADSESVTDSIQTLGLRSIICVPLLLPRVGAAANGPDKAGGVIYVDSLDEANPLTETQKQLVEALASQTAVAIENARAFEKAERDRAQIERLKEDLGRLHEVSQSLCRTLDLDALLVQVTDHCVEISKAERGFVMLLEHAKGPKGSHGGQPKLVYKVGRDQYRHDLPATAFAYSETVARQCIETKAPIVIGDSAATDRSMSMRELNLQSLVCVPLLDRGEPIGLINVDSKLANKEFSPHELELLESLAGSAAVAIANARLYDGAREQARIAHEVERAAEIQRELLPTEDPDVERLEIHGVMMPAKEVSGDYYDFIPHPGTKGSLTICIGDVSGKGLGAGMLMTVARATLRSLVESAGGPPESTRPLMQTLNATLCDTATKGSFMTANVLNWWAAERKLKYTPAGHEHLLVFRKKVESLGLVEASTHADYAAAGAGFRGSGRVEVLKAGGVAAGVMRSANDAMVEESIELAAGDQVLLYTGGVTEARNGSRASFGLDALVGILGHHGELAPKELCEKIQHELSAFCGGAPNREDVTLVALRCSG